MNHLLRPSNREEQQSRCILTRQVRPSFQPGESLLMRASYSQWDTLVEFRGVDGDIALVICKGQTHQVPLDWLRTQGTPLR